MPLASLIRWSFRDIMKVNDSTSKILYAVMSRDILVGSADVGLRKRITYALGKCLGRPHFNITTYSQTPYCDRRNPMSSDKNLWN